MATILQLHPQNQSLAAARRYAAIGWHVFPLTPGQKTPLGQLAPRGFHNATTDSAVIERWWGAQPLAGIGVALKASGLVAVDIDPRNGGLDSMDALEAQHGPICSDVLAYTGGGGEHRVFSSSLVEGLPGKLGRGIDLKADGYICVWPTLHPSGITYEWEASSDPLDGAVPSTLPGWVRDLVRRPLPSPEARIDPLLPAIDPRRLLDLRDALPHICSDLRDDWITVGQAIHNEMPGEDGFVLWDSWSQASDRYDPRDQVRVWRSFRIKGIAGVGPATIFKMAQDAGWRNSAARDAGLMQPAAVLDHNSGQPGLVLSLRQLATRVQNQRWLIKGAMPAQSLGVIFGSSGTFKSFIALDMALYLAHGLHWLGRKTATGKVVYVAAEGGAGLYNRIDAWHRQASLTMDACASRFFVCPHAVVLDDATQLQALREAILAVCPDPALIVIDTMSQTFSGNESANNEVAGFFRGVRNGLIDATGAAVAIIHHNGHSDHDRARGASAISANADWMFQISREGQDLCATLTNTKQKDSELLAPVSFAMTVQTLCTDEDGDPVTSLVAAQNMDVDTVVNNGEKRESGHLERFVMLCSEYGDMLIASKKFREYLVSEHGFDADASRSVLSRTKRAAIDKKRISLDDGGAVYVFAPAARQGAV